MRTAAGTLYAIWRKPHWIEVMNEFVKWTNEF